MGQMQSFLEALRTNRVSDVELTVAIVVLAALVFFLVLRSRWQERMARFAAKRHDRRDFFELCRLRGLDREELELLTQSAARFDEQLAPGLVESNVHFDCFARRIINEAYAPEIPRLNFVLTRIREKLGFRPPARGLALNSTRELCPGQRLYLVFDGDRFQEGMVSEVDETKLVVQLSAGATSPLPQVSAEPVRIYFNRPGDARYSVSCYILKIHSDIEGLFVTLSHCEALKRDQRRNDFRVDESRSVHVWVVNHFEDAAEQVKDVLRSLIPEEALLEDLSGGGASLIFSRELPAHQQVYINLNGRVGDSLPIVRGTVIRSQARSGRGHWAISVRFEDLRPSERQKLVQHVFTQEREIIRAF